MKGSATGSTALLPPAAMCGVRKSWTADRCTAVLENDALSVSVCALDSWTYLSDFEIFIDEVRHILTKGLSQGATGFQVAAGLNVQMEFDDVTEKDVFLNGMHVWTDRCKDLDRCLVKECWMDVMTITWWLRHTQIKNHARLRRRRSSLTTYWVRTVLLGEPTSSVWKDCERGIIFCDDVLHQSRRKKR